MYANQLSTCFCTEQVDECRMFYTRYFDAKRVFDCGWYLTLQFSGGAEVSFIEPQEGMTPFQGAGVMLNFKVEDVDSEAAKLGELGLDVVMPLEDHPWGDRGFSVADPIGNMVYIYSDREPAEEFKQFRLG